SYFPFFLLLLRLPPSSTLFPYTTLFRSLSAAVALLIEQKRVVALDHGSGKKVRRLYVAADSLREWLQGGAREPIDLAQAYAAVVDRKSTRLNSSHDQISYAVFCLKKKKK